MSLSKPLSPKTEQSDILVQQSLILVKKAFILREEIFNIGTFVLLLFTDSLTIYYYFFCFVCILGFNVLTINVYNTITFNCFFLFFLVVAYTSSFFSLLFMVLYHRIHEAHSNALARFLVKSGSCWFWGWHRLHISVYLHISLRNETTENCD